MNAIGQPPLDWLVNRLVLIALLGAKAPLVAPITYFAAVHESVPGRFCCRSQRGDRREAGRRLLVGWPAVAAAPVAVTLWYRITSSLSASPKAEIATMRNRRSVVKVSTVPGGDTGR
jgi:hypothetical protein